MAEGVALADGQVVGVHDDPDAPPAPDPARAPKGWTWDRSKRSWRPKVRGRLTLAGSSSPRQQQDVPDPAHDRAPGDGVSGQDPAPGWQAAEGPAANGKLDFEDVPQQVKDDIAGLAGLVGAPVLSLLQSLDPYCGTALAQNFEPVVDAALPLICRSEKIVRYFAEDKADWLLWGKLAMALKPVAQAIAEHHIFRTVEIVKDPKTGQKTIVERDRSQGGHGDHLQPPVVDPSLYVA